MGRLLDVMADTSDVRLRAALEAREQARARKEDALNAIEMAESAEEMSDLQALAQDSEGALEAASQAVDHALGMKRQAINAGHGIVPGTTPESFAEAHVDLLDELVVDLECCPRARKTLLRHTPSPPAGHAAELALSKSKLTVLAVVRSPPELHGVFRRQIANCLHLFRTDRPFPFACLIAHRVTVHCPFARVREYLLSSLLPLGRRCTACQVRTHSLDPRTPRIPERTSQLRPTNV